MSHTGGLPTPNKPSDEYSPASHPDYNFMRTHEKEAGVERTERKRTEGNKAGEEDKARSYWALQAAVIWGLAFILKYRGKRGRMLSKGFIEHLQCTRHHSRLLEHTPGYQLFSANR